MFIPSILITAVLLCSITPSTALSLQAPLQCLQMKDKLEHLDTDKFINNMATNVCNRNCKPTLSDMQAHVFIPAIQRACTETDSTSLSGNYISLLDSLMTMGYDKCGVKKGEDMCGDMAKFKNAAKCIQANSWSLALSNVGDFVPIVASNPRQKVTDYVSDEEKFQGMLNGLMEKYSATCH